MPYYRRSYRRSYRKRYRRRRPRAPKAISAVKAAGVLASKAMAGVKYLKTLVNVEKKLVDTVLTDVLYPTGDVKCLTNIATADTYNARDGNSVLTDSLSIRCSIGNLGSTGTNCNVKFSLIEDMQLQSDTDPTIAQIFETADPFSYLNHEHLGRFKVHWSKVWSVGIDGTQVKNEDLFLKLPNHHVRFNGTGSTDIQKGALFLVRMTDSSTPVRADYNIRYRFIDN